MNIPTLVLSPRRNGLRNGTDNTVDVLVRVRGPELPAGELPARGPLHVALVIDRSGSMSGRPLCEALRCAEFVVNGLAPQDAASLVAYDDTPQLLAALTPAARRHELAQAIATIHEGGSTNLHGGWIRGAESLAPQALGNVLSRVILLSDGCANAGLTDPAAIYRQCEELASAGVTTSTYGLGRNFNEDLMIGMARAGRGNAYYGQTAADLADPFREELALLNALCATQLRVEVSAPAGVGITALNDYALAGPNAWIFPDLAFGGEVWMVLRLTVPAAVAEGAGAASVCTVSVRYHDRAGEPRAIAAATLSLPVLGAADYDALAENAEVAQRVRELDAARAQEEARAAARRGDWAAVTGKLDLLAGIAGNDEMLGGLRAELQEMATLRDSAVFAKEAAYSARYLRNRMASANIPDEGDTDALQAEFLRKKQSLGRRRPRV